MSYESDLLKDSLARHLNHEQSEHNMFMHRLQMLESFMKRAEPYIKAMELIDPPPKQTP